MSHRLLRTFDELDAWLAEHGEFEDGFLEELNPMPDPIGRVPETVRLVLSYQIGGGWRAGEERALRSINVEAQNVTRFELPPGECVQLGNCMEDVVAIDAPEGLGLRLTVPAFLDIVATCYEVAKPTERRILIR